MTLNEIANVVTAVATSVGAVATVVGGVAFLIGQRRKAAERLWFDIQRVDAKTGWGFAVVRYRGPDPSLGLAVDLKVDGAALLCRPPGPDDVDPMNGRSLEGDKREAAATRSLTLRPRLDRETGVWSADFQYKAVITAPARFVVTVRSGVKTIAKLRKFAGPAH